MGFHGRYVSQQRGAVRVAGRGLLKSLVSNGFSREEERDRTKVAGSSTVP